MEGLLIKYHLMSVLPNISLRMCCLSGSAAKLESSQTVGIITEVVHQMIVHDLFLHHFQVIAFYFYCLVRGLFCSDEIGGI